MSKFKAWYIPQVPMKAFEREFDSLETASLVLNAVIDFSIFEFENKVKPDYSDAAGIAMWDEESGEWEDVDDSEWERNDGE
jgi:hypothetical protein